MHTGTVTCFTVMVKQGKKRGGRGGGGEGGLKLWADYAAIWNVLIDIKSFATPEDKATKLEQLVDPWIELFHKCAPAAQYLYPHILQSHMPEFIRTMPRDPFFLQTQGLEHRNKQRKRIHLRVTNFRAPAKNGEKVSSMARTQQAFSYVLVRDELENNATVSQLEHERKRKDHTNELRQLAKAKRLFNLADAVAQ